METKEKGTIISVQDFYGEILEILDTKVSVLCLIDEENSILQERLFDITPLEGYINLEVGSVILISIVTSVGSISYNFSNESEDKKSLFIPKDVFAGLENTAFFKEG